MAKSPVKPEPKERIVQVDHVTKSIMPTSGSGFFSADKIVTSIVATDGQLYQINEENGRKHSKYFEAKLGERIGVEDGELLKLRGHGRCEYEDGWDIVKTK